MGFFRTSIADVHRAMAQTAPGVEWHVEPADSDPKKRYWYVGLHREDRAHMPSLSLEQARLMAPSVYANLGGLRGKVSVEVWVESDDGKWVGCGASGPRVSEYAPRCLQRSQPPRRSTESGVQPEVSRGIDLMKALLWYSVLGTYDEVVAPSRWVWSEFDVEVNRTLNELIWQSPSNWQYLPEESHGMFSSVVAVPPPDSMREWASDSVRLSMNITSAGHVPRYFPDDTNDYFLLTGKDFMVSGCQLAVIDTLKRIVAEDGISVTDPNDVSEPPEGRVYFSISQYVRFHPYVASEVKDFSTQPDTRAALYKRWRDGCFPEGDLAVGVLQQVGGSLATIPLSVAQDLVRTLWFKA